MDKLFEHQNSATGNSKKIIGLTTVFGFWSVTHSHIGL